MEVKEKENLEELTRKELLELVKQLKKEVERWQYRFVCVDKEYNVISLRHGIPRI